MKYIKLIEVGLNKMSNVIDTVGLDASFASHQLLLKYLNTGRTYNCRLCGICIDRDINGARNILIKTKLAG